MRRGPQHFLHSRLMCWVAVDRAIRLASKRSLAAPFSRWIDVRNNIYEDIWSNFWNEEKGHFVQTKGGDTLDASLLLMPLVRFVSATDPRWLATLDAIGETLADDGLVHRYKSEDGLSGQEGVVLCLLVLVCRMPGKGWRLEEGACDLRSTVELRQPSGPLRRRVRPPR